MSEPRPKSSALGPYEAGYSAVVAVKRNPAAAFFYIIAVVCLAFGAVRLTVEPGGKNRYSFESRQTRAYIQGASCVSLSGFLFVSGSILAARGRG